jgi:hypothetical protein
MTDSVATAAMNSAADSGLRQRKPALSESKEPTGMETDGKDKEEVTWGKTASGEGKLLGSVSIIKLIKQCSRYQRPTLSSTLSQLHFTAPP